MAGKIPDETLQAVRERISIVEVVSAYVTLKKSGRNYLGLCPFHAEKTPSFTVSDERGLFHCFGCGAGGTVFTFVMRADRVEFREAVESLARRVGIALPERGEGGPNREQRQQLFDLNEAAQQHFREALRSAAGNGARQYLGKRGVKPTTIDTYGVGFCPAGGGGLARLFAAKRISSQQAIELGLIGRRADGSAYDRLWGRVTFPIRDGSGRILGFGGRTLGTEQPKYLNSPESALFHKGQVLYGLFEARDAVREAERVVIVEGYLDALSLVEAGIGYAVATLGTAVTPDQLRLARRFAPEVIAFFDGDRAGQAAAVRAFGICADAGIWGLGAFLPDGFDPDKFVRERGAPATRQLLEQAVPLADFFIDRFTPGADAPLRERARAAEQVAQMLVRVRDPFQFGLLAQQAAQRLGVDEAIFRNARDPRATGPPRAERPAPGRVDAAEAFRPEEITLVEAMALDREVADLVAHRGALKLFRSTALAEGGGALMAAWARDDSSAAGVDALPTAVAERVTAALLGAGAVGAGDDRLQIARDCVRKIEERAQRQQTGEAVRNLREAEASGDAVSSRRALERATEQLRRRDSPQ
jgi:DNA primase